MSIGSNSSPNCLNYEPSVIQGFEYMKNQSVVIAGLARDIEPRLDYLIPKLLRLVSYFKNYKIIFVENDSKDNTREVLLNLAKQNPNIIVLGCGVNSNECKLNLQRHNSFQAGKDRIGKMAYLRNIYLDFIKRYFRNYDYSMFIDYDLFGSFYYDGIANSFYYLQKYPSIDALGANGINVFMKSYYDPFALVEEGHPIEYQTMMQKTLHDIDIFRRYKLKKCDPLVKVRSCFAGLAIYRMRSVLDRTYDYSKTAIACEHSFFNDGLNMYINPSMLINILMN